MLLEYPMKVNKIEGEGENQKTTRICPVFKNIGRQNKLYLNDSNALLFHY